MRWDSLFDDLEGQLDSASSPENIERRAEDERLRIGRLSLRDRLIGLGNSTEDARSAAGIPGNAVTIRVGLRCGRDVSIVPRTYGRDWIAADLVRQHGGQSACLIALAGITSILIHPGDVERSIADRAGTHGPQITDRIGLPFVLRDLCRRRSYVSITTARSAEAIGGTIDRVARDHVDIARHDRGTVRRAGEVAHVQLMALAELDIVEL